MKKKILAALTAATLVLCSWTTAFAQEEDKAPYVVPVDTFTCNYNEGKGPGDLKKAIANWNKWMDDQGTDSYGAMLITPYYYGEDSFDIGWLGYWTSQEAMGAGIDKYLAEGGESAEGFNDVLTCASHSHWATIQLKAPSAAQQEKGVLMFSDCSIESEDGWDDLYASLKKSAAYMTEQNYNNGMWMMWPVFGAGGESTYDFKAVTHWDNYTDFGKAYQHRANGGGRQALNEIMGDRLDCDTSRVYNTKTVRNVPPPETDQG